MKCFLLAVLLLSVNSVFAKTTEVDSYTLTDTSRGCKFFSTRSTYKSCNKLNISVQDFTSHIATVCSRFVRFEQDTNYLEVEASHLAELKKARSINHEKATKTGADFKESTALVESSHVALLEAVKQALSEEGKIGDRRLEVAKKIKGKNKPMEALLLRCALETNKAREFVNYIKIGATADKEAAANRIDKSLKK